MEDNKNDYWFWKIKKTDFIWAFCFFSVFYGTVMNTMRKDWRFLILTGMGLVSFKLLIDYYFRVVFK